ncbi:aromatic-ring-hydroxylating dioxygenase subunit beta [Shewanella inventionis]|uniref:Aromatic-ring-hydroxylating dioxygenase subunit beta n=1 Tax=Shewanella inventionis TaxID=1738770 RepID=A0ABQ1JUP5_9GAMM|nr:aromatic-ring-hydroxylating dioxygenase subunit beta [Shewanella inventionis]MCL1159795.1 hypothetical protein [Shewanella inventionis]GGB75114.1 hypothetical protein GCM10011607_39320 [Shewanella inventionis]
MTDITKNNDPLVFENDIAFDELVKKTNFSEKLNNEVAAFLYRESRLLDARMYKTWHSEILSQDIRYIVASKELRSTRERRYNQPDTVYLFNDDHRQLGIRVEHDLDPQNWRSSPLEIYSRIVSNIELAQDDNSSDIHVRSVCLISRGRRAYQLDQFIYSRNDILTRNRDGQLQLKSRYIHYPERSVSGHNMLMYL